MSELIPAKFVCRSNPDLDLSMAFAPGSLPQVGDRIKIGGAFYKVAGRTLLADDGEWLIHLVKIFVPAARAESLELQEATT